MAFQASEPLGVAAMGEDPMMVAGCDPAKKGGVPFGFPFELL